MANYSQITRRLCMALSICSLMISILAIIMTTMYGKTEIDYNLKTGCVSKDNNGNQINCSYTAPATLAFMIGIILTYLFTARLLWYIVCDIKVSSISDLLEQESIRLKIIHAINVILWIYSFIMCLIAWGLNARVDRYIPVTPLQWWSFVHSLIALAMSGIYLLRLLLHLFGENLCPVSVKELCKCSWSSCHRQRGKWIDAKCRLCKVELSQGIDILNCDHAFHTQCISGKVNCPTCNV